MSLSVIDEGDIRLVYDSCYCVLYRAKTRDAMDFAIASIMCDVLSDVPAGLEVVTLCSAFHMSDCRRFYACESRTGVELRDARTDEVLRAIPAPDESRVRRWGVRVIGAEPHMILELFPNKTCPNISYEVFPPLENSDLVSQETLRDWCEQSKDGV